MLLKIGDTVINDDQVTYVELRATLDLEYNTPLRHECVVIHLARGRAPILAANSVEGLAATWFFTEATEGQVLLKTDLIKDPRTLDVVALYRRHQPML